MKKSEFWVIVILILIAIGISIASMVIVNNKTSSSGITGQATGNVTANMGELVAFTLDPAIVNFGTVGLGVSNSTPEDKPSFGIVNDGSVKINMTIDSNNALFTGTFPTYQFKSVCTDGGCAVTVYDWTTFNQSAQNLVKILEFAQNLDAMTVGIKITVPLDEPAGAKSDVLTFTAIQA
jgi:hypothetical protein